MPNSKVLKVLLVEDSADDALLLMRQIRKGGFMASFLRVEEEGTMRDALVSERWDICITDHNMPSFDSTAALLLIRESGLDIPTVIVSGSIGEEIAVKAMKAGANDYIMKDNLTRLVPAIERELRDAGARKARRDAEDEIRYMAYHDALTSLNNRNEFDIRLRQALQNAQHNNLQHTVLYLDLDQFKIINDTCGHIAGDELLKQLSLQLKSQVREGDTLARLGGDEFGVLLENCPLEQAQSIAEKILSAVRSFAFSWQNRSFAIGVSIGMVMVDSKSESVDSIMSAADMACYAAKDQGRNRIRLYSDADIEFSQRRGEMDWVNKIKLALEKNQFQLYCQSIIPLSDSVLSSHHEFLIRLNSEAGEVILPGTFLPAAERFDLMPSIDRWVIKSAFEYLSNLEPMVDGEESGIFFVNLSGASLMDDGLFDFIRAQVESYNIVPSMICFEVTETVAISNLDITAKFMERCRDVGFKFALDDFGSGFCSFSYLKAVPVDYLKIDGGFVQNMLEDKIDCSIVESVNNIGHVAGLKTIAEYVESPDILEKLKSMGIDFAQGYCIDRPRSLAEISAERKEAVLV